MSTYGVSEVQAKRPHFGGFSGIGGTALGIISRYGLAIIWLVSGYQKIVNPLAFRQSIEAYEMFPPGLVSVIATLLPPVEILLGIFLLVGLFLRASAALTAMLMIGFIVGLSSAAIRGLSIDCGCFSPGDGEPSSLGLVIARDILFLAMALWVIKNPFRKFALYP